MRVFLAYPIDDQEKLYFSEQAVKFYEYFDGKWVDKSNYHITIKFLGEVRDSKLTEIIYSLENIVNSLKNFEIDIDRYGFFGKPNPKVLWFGPSFIKNDNIMDNFHIVQSKLSNLGFGKEKLYIPHITVCRIKRVKKKFDKDMNYKGMKINIKRIVLYKSVLTPKGSKYFEIKGWKI